VRIITLTLAYTLVGILNASAQSSEHDAIKKTLHDETAAFYAANFEAWQSHWVHDEHVTAALVGTTRSRHLRGWEAIAGRVAKAIKAAGKPTKADIVEANFNIRQEGNLAWVEYDETVTTEGEKESSHEYRVLIKTGGAWKIVSQVHIDSEAFKQK
jgi:ketosteroid isomerase-like protein